MYGVSIKFLNAEVMELLQKRRRHDENEENKQGMTEAKT
jgi:hypothetical protein